MILSTFSCTCWPFVCLLWESIFQALCLFLNQFIFYFYFLFFVINCMNSLYVLDINPLLDIKFTSIFSHSICCFFILLMVNFIVQSFLVWCSLICLFIFACAFRYHSQKKKSLPIPVSRSFFLIFCSASFRVSGFMFKSLNHFKLIFVSCTK